MLWIMVLSSLILVRKNSLQRKTCPHSTARHGTARHDDLCHIVVIFIKIIIRYPGSVMPTLPLNLTSDLLAYS
jgi:hypothetical protein